MLPYLEVKVRSFLVKFRVDRFRGFAPCAGLSKFPLFLYLEEWLIQQVWAIPPNLWLTSCTWRCIPAPFAACISMIALASHSTFRHFCAVERRLSVNVCDWQCSCIRPYYSTASIRSNFAQSFSDMSRPVSCTYASYVLPYQISVRSASNGTWCTWLTNTKSKAVYNLSTKLTTKHSNCWRIQPLQHEQHKQHVLKMSRTYTSTFCSIQ